MHRINEFSYVWLKREIALKTSFLRKEHNIF